MTPETKRCTRCRRNKPASEFYRQADHADGLMSACKACQKRQRRERATDQTREHRLRYQHAWRTADRALRAAHPTEFAALLETHLAAQGLPVRSSEDH